MEEKSLRILLSYIGGSFPFPTWAVNHWNKLRAHHFYSIYIMNENFAYVIHKLPDPLICYPSIRDQYHNKKLHLFQGSAMAKW